MTIFTFPHCVREGLAAPNDGWLKAWVLPCNWAIDIGYLPLGEDSE